MKKNNICKMSQENGYNVMTVLNLFKNCIKQDNVSIELLSFITAYKELIK